MIGGWLAQLTAGPGFPSYHQRVKDRIFLGWSLERGMGIGAEGPQYWRVILGSGDPWIPILRVRREQNPPRLAPFGGALVESETYPCT